MRYLWGVFFRGLLVFFVFLGRSLASAAVSRAALFLCRRHVFTAFAMTLCACLTFSTVGFVFAFLMLSLRAFLFRVLIAVRFLSFLSFLIADLMIGITIRDCIIDRLSVQ